MPSPGAALRALLVIFVVACAPATAPTPPRTIGHTAPPPSVRASPSIGERPRSRSPEPATPATSPTPPPAPERRYDLAADLETRRSEALGELGARTQSELVEDVFLILSPVAYPGLVESIDVTRRALRAYFNGRFSRRPEKAISVYLFPDATGYDRYCARRWRRSCDSPYGFYLHDQRRIIMNVGLGVGTLTHELVHPLVATDFPGAPDWINEGIASLFERFSLPRPGDIRGAKNWRHPRLLRALQSKQERERARASLSALFGMTDQVFRGDMEDLNYATARYFCQWLDENNLLWPFYRTFRDGYAADPTGEKAFVAVVGKTPAEADAEWARWVRRL